jgi:hypothetical protein
MLLFRSEEHLERWLEDDRRPRGEALRLEQQWRLARLWFRGRHLPEWRKRTADEAEAVFRDAGLTGNFWRFGRRERATSGARRRLSK